MIASEIRWGQLSLTIVGATEFASPNHESVFQQAVSLQVSNQCRGGLIGFSALPGQSSWHIAVMIPARVIQLNEPHTAFGQSSSQQAIRGECPGFLTSGPYSVKDAMPVRRKNRSRPGSKFAFEMRVRTARFAFEYADRRSGRIVVDACFSASIDARRLVCINPVGIAQIQHRIFTATKADALMSTGQKTAAPKSRYHGCPPLFLVTMTTNAGRSSFSLPSP